MNLFNSKPEKTNLSSVRSKAQGALGMFKTALTQLEECNEDAEEIQNTNAARILKLQDENSDLSQVLIENNKIIRNISNLIEA